MVPSSPYAAVWLVAVLHSYGSSGTAITLPFRNVDECQYAAEEMKSRNNGPIWYQCISGTGKP